MSAATSSPAPVQFRPTEHRVTFGGLLRSEWIKFWSVRSVVVTMAAAFVAVVGFGILLPFAVGSQPAAERGGPPGGPSGGLDPTALSLQGAQLASLIVAALGVIVIAGEYSTGMIRTSFVSAPRRLGVLAAKAIVLAVTVAVVLGVAVFVAFLLGQAVLDRNGTGASLSDDGVLRAVLGNVAVLVGIALAGLGLGALMRNSAGAICTILAALFVLPLLLLALPESWGGPTIREYYFANATTNSVAVQQQSDYLGIGAGFAVFGLWVVVLLALGALRAKTRDV